MSKKNAGNKVSKDLDNIKDLFGQSFTLAEDIKPVEVMPTGLREIDEIMFSIGGLPRGRVIEIAGETHSGKTTLVQWMCGKVQKEGGNIAWFDTEKTFRPEYAVKSGLDVTKVVMPKFGYGEDLTYKLLQAVASNYFDVIVIDSQDAVISQSVGEVSPDGLTMADHLSRAKMWNSFYRNLVGGFTVKDAKGKPIKSNFQVPRIIEGKEKMFDTIHDIGQKKACVIIVSHLMPRPGEFGKPMGTTGGKKAEYNFSIRVWLGTKKPKTGQSNKKTVLKHSLLKLKSEKNKLGPLIEGGKCEILMMPDGTFQSATEAEAKAKKEAEEALENL